ncbi:nucleotidyltransferase domain-containing protein [Salinigranum halophilum]|uniref:nucleotidyltransferase domain-containing protein n=1 Tax=Salinigranum halophilum TaxID=2565931 RepID=UPI0010A92C9D|nr:nucleotidyltransferase domain-containing protein [Salinigranum halophilum]
MTSGAIPSRVLAALEESVCPDSDVTFVVAFGSQVSGEPTRTSDLDLAVKFSDELSDSERFEKQYSLSGRLQQEEAPFVDLTDIETLPIDIAHDALDGRFVCGDEDAYEQFKHNLETTFAEQRDTIRRQQRDVIDRIAEDGLRG